MCKEMLLRRVGELQVFIALGRSIVNIGATTLFLTYHVKFIYQF